MGYIITIGRQFGSGGRRIGRALSEALGYAYYDKNLIELAAKQVDGVSDVLEKLDEKASNKLFVPIPSPAYASGTAISCEPGLADKLFFAQSDLILDIEQRENAVIVGRCADYVLQGKPNVLRVFIKASKESRIANVANYEKIGEKQAAALIARTKRKRAKYYNYYTGRKWGDAKNYDLIIDSGLGVDTAVNVIKAALPNEK